MSRFWLSSAAAAAMMSLAACGGGQAAAPASAQADAELTPAPTISGAEARQFVSYGAILLDVSPTNLAGASAVEGSINIPMAELRDRMDELPRDNTIVVYCLSGRASPRAAAVLIAEGYDAHALGSRAKWEDDEPGASGT